MEQKKIFLSVDEDTSAGAASLSEDEQWRAFRNGDKKAFEGIYFAHYDRLLHYGLKMIRDREQVRECIQELFFKLWNRRESLGQVKSVRAYLYTAFRRTVLDALEVSSRNKAFSRQAPAALELTFSFEDFLIEQQHGEHQRQCLLDALNALTKRQREAVYLRFFGELDFEKVAETMHVSVQSVRNLIHQACKILRQRLDWSQVAVFVFFLPALFS